MKIKLFMGEWFYNAGLIGFCRIYKNNENAIFEGENYIEFDSDILKNFHNYYFDYFMEKYNVAEKMRKILDNDIGNIKLILSNAPDAENSEKNRKEKLKNAKKFLKNKIKIQLDKIKKYNDNIYNQMLIEYDKIDSLNDENDCAIADEIANNLKNLFNDDEINKKLTSNIFKNVLSDQYYGQVSFLNVVKSSLSFDEQKQVMYKDFVSNIIENAFLNDVLNDRYSIEEISEHINNALESNLITTNIEKIYTKIVNKFIAKNTTLDEIKKYIQNDVLKYCSFCESMSVNTEDYTEGNFIPLAMSSTNAKNFFWNQKVNFPICDMCRLILFCIPIGSTTIYKVNKEIENGKTTYKEKEIQNFVNYDTSLKMLREINDNFLNNIKKYENENMYEKLIMDIIDQDEKLSKWKLENVFFVEFEAKYKGYSRINYFNIPTYVARFFVEYSKRTLNLVRDYKYKLQLVNDVLNNKDLKYAINDKFYDIIVNYLMQNKKYINTYDTWLSVNTRFYLSQLKKGEKMSKDYIDENEKKLYVIYKIGIEIHEKLKKDNLNKLAGYTYKILNNCKSGNIKELLDTIIRLHMFAEVDVSPIFIDSITSKGIDLLTVGQAFVSGLISEGYDSKKQNKEVDVNE